MCKNLTCYTNQLFMYHTLFIRSSFTFGVYDVMFIIIFRYYQVNLFQVKLIDGPALRYIYTI